MGSMEDVLVAVYFIHMQIFIAIFFNITNEKRNFLINFRNIWLIKYFVLSVNSDSLIFWTFDF